MPILLNPQEVEDWQALRTLWRQDPVAYAMDRIGMRPTVQQRQLLTAIAPPGAKVSVRAGHGVGKSTAESVAILWHLECFDYSRIPCTASSASQLRQVLWAEIAKCIRWSDEQSARNGLPRPLWLSNLFKLTEDRIYDLGSPNEWFAAARTARKENPDALQGFHASDILITEDGSGIERSGEGGSIMFVVEEASGIPDEIFEVAEGALSSPGARLLMVGNPTKNTGYFARSHKDAASEYSTLHFRCSDSPLVDKDYRAKLIRKFGDGSNVVRVRADGEFPKQDDDSLISFELVEQARLRDAHPPQGRNRLGVDVARFGDDRTTLVLRDDLNVTHVAVRAKQDTMETTGQVLAFCEKHDVDEVYIDVIGVGAGVFDRLKELKRKNRFRPRLVPVNVANKAPWNKAAKPEDGKPFKMRDHLWMAAAKWVQSAEPSFANLERETAKDLAGELSSIKYKIDSNGKIVVESKSDMKERGLRSPDLADGLCLTFAPEPEHKALKPLVFYSPIGLGI